MAINDPAGLFLYDLSTQYDAEVKGAALLSAMLHKVGDGEAAQPLRREEQKAQARIRNLDACFARLDSTPMNVPCATVDGMRAEFDRFLGQNPSFDAIQMYAAGAATKLYHFDVGGYRGLVDEAMQIDQADCAHLLRTNVLRAEESASRMERLKQDVTANVVMPA